MYPYLLHVSTLLPPTAWIIIGGLLLTGGDIWLRHGMHVHSAIHMGLAFGLYMVGVACMVMNFFHQHIAIATIAAVVVNMTTYLLYAWWVYGETISPQQSLGLAFGVLTIILLEI